MVAPSRWLLVFAALVASAVLASSGDPTSSASDDADVKYVHCGSTAGSFVIEVHPSWAPLGAQRYLTLVENGFYDGVALFRSVKGFLVQFGMPAEPLDKWRPYMTGKGRIQDDPPRGIPFEKGYVSFAGAGANSRTVQVFITYNRHPHLGKVPHETAFGRVVRGIESVDRFETKYGDISAFNPKGVSTQKLATEGNSYIHREFPDMSFLTTCRVFNSLQEADAAGSADAASSSSAASAAGGGASEAPPATIPLPKETAVPVAVADPPFVYPSFRVAATVLAVVGLVALVLRRPKTADDKTL